ncbi:MAG TPA: carboxypeptidase-like regulatory domain-containing protein [Planctomycetota bacterium]|nr:carboxypeptidase-like regulatory domain-containing protein [Planctomycetota bacterium]
MKIRGPLVVCWLAFALPLACQRDAPETRVGGSSFPTAPPEGTASVCGTVIDLQSGEVAAGVEVALTGGFTARTDDHGRFQIDGLALGTRGEVFARSADGRTGTVTLLPLAHERHEIVLNLKAR